MAEGRLRGAAANANVANPSPQPSPLASQRERGKFGAVATLLSLFLLLAFSAHAQSLRLPPRPADSLAGRAVAESVTTLERPAREERLGHVVADEADDGSAEVVLRVIHGEESALLNGCLPFTLAASLGEFQWPVFPNQRAEADGLAHGWQGRCSTVSSSA